MDNLIQFKRREPAANETKAPEVKKTRVCKGIAVGFRFKSDYAIWLGSTGMQPYVDEGLGCPKPGAA